MAQGVGSVIQAVTGLVGCLATIAAALIAYKVLDDGRKNRRADDKAAHIRQARSVFGRLGGVTENGRSRPGAPLVGRVNCSVHNASKDALLWARVRIWCKVAEPDPNPFVSDRVGRIAPNGNYDFFWDFHIPLAVPPERYSRDAGAVNKMFDLEIEYADIEGNIWVRRGVAPPEPSPY